MSRLHLDILIELRTLTQYGLAAETLLAYLRRGAHRAATEPEVVQALRDLGDKAYVVAYDSALGGRRWRITELGKSALREEGL